MSGPENLQPNNGVAVTQADRDCTRDVINALHLGIGGVSEIIAARHRQSATAPLEAQIAELVEALRMAREGLVPFGKLGDMANFAFAPALFADHQSLKDLPWSENGKPVTATFGDVRKAAATLAKIDALMKGQNDE